jgi:hypothetical protein
MDSYLDHKGMRIHKDRISILGYFTKQAFPLLRSCCSSFTNHHQCFHESMIGRSCPCFSELLLVHSSLDIKTQEKWSNSNYKTSKKKAETWTDVDMTSWSILLFTLTWNGKKKNRISICVAPIRTEHFNFFHLFTPLIGTGLAQWYRAVLRAGWSGVRDPVGADNFSFHHRVQTSSGAHPAYYPMGTRGSFPGG